MLVGRMPSLAMGVFSGWKRSGMKVRFGWAAAAVRYEELYRAALARREEALP